ncbi:BEM_collapsed_G0002060.mRNA.1.CDS.1 [Saccharomyces cerevisiae]|nr:BEM_collapsed_G0002060.mRNA.1.CDS.1 [Saccharomyces cerevisiae]
MSSAKAEKKPASKAPAEKKPAAKKTSTSVDGKKRSKVRKETYSSLYLQSFEANSPRHWYFPEVYVYFELFR